MTLGELAVMSFPPRKLLFAPWLAERSLAMVHAFRGIGKSWLVGTIACAVASGGRVFERAGAGPAWTANGEARGVLFVDGEMPLRALQQRFAELVVGGGFDVGDRLRLLACDRFDDPPLPSLATPEGQAIVNSHLDESISLVVFDNFSTLFRGLDENSADAWDPVQEFLLSLRRRGYGVLGVHHSGKGGAQRGTSKREDVLDTAIKLARPDDYDEGQGARFTVTFEKARGLSGSDVESFEASLSVDESRGATWTARDIEDESDQEIQALHREGKSLRTIAKELGMDASTVSRRLKRIARRDAARG